MATFKPTNASQLIDDIATANLNNEADTIELCGTYVITGPNHSDEFGQNGLPKITSPIKIVGTFIAVIVRDPSASDFRFFHVTSIGSLTLEKVSLVGGKTDFNGGAILNEGSLKLNNCDLVDNQALLLSGGGGAIYNNVKAKLSIKDKCFLSGNSAQQGGAIYNRGKLNVSNSEFNGNTADYGGAIFNNIPPTTGGPAILGLNIGHYRGNAPAGTWTYRGAIFKTNDVLTDLWEELQTALPVVDQYGVPLLRYINLDPFDTNNAIAFFMDGSIYINRSWKTGGEWEALVTKAEIDAAVFAVYGQVFCPRDNQNYPATGTCIDATLSIAEQGTFYTVSYLSSNECPSNNHPFPIQFKNYGEVINIGQGMEFAGGDHKYSMASVNIQASNTDPNRIFLTAKKYAHNDDWLSTEETDVWRAQWGSFLPTNGDGYWVGQWEEASVPNLDRFTALFIPTKKEDGSPNTNDQEIYLLGHQGTISKSTDSGSNFIPWGPSGVWPHKRAGSDGVNVPGSFRDMFELVTLPDCHAYFITQSDNDTEPDVLYVCRQKGDPWDAYALPWNNRVGWVGGWSSENMLLYIGGGSIQGTFTDSFVLMATSDPAGGFADLTHNVKTLPAYDSSSETITIKTHAVVGCIPDF